MADEKLPARISHRLFAISRSEMRINMKERKIIAILLILIMIISMSACGKSNQAQSENNSSKSNTTDEVSSDDEKKLKDMAVEMTDSLSELISSDAYLETITSSEEIRKVIESWQNLKVDKNESIYVITLDAQTIEKYISSTTKDNIKLSEMPEQTKEYLFSRIGDSIGNIINNKEGGTSVLAASSVARYSKTFVPEVNIENQVWILPCDDEYAVCISFSNTGNGVLTVTASYIVFNAESCNSLLENIGFTIKKLV